MRSHAMERLAFVLQHMINKRKREQSESKSMSRDKGESEIQSESVG